MLVKDNGGIAKALSVLGEKIDSLESDVSSSKYLCEVAEEHVEQLETEIKKLREQLGEAKS